MSDRYKKEVIDPGDRASKLAKKICFDSHDNCPAVSVVSHQPDNFRGGVGFTWNRFVLELMQHDHPHNWRMMQGVENDGAGGKPQFFTLVSTPEVFRGLGWEIITMTADDFARSGRFPAIIVNEINTKNINDSNFPLVQACLEGYGQALEKANLVNITGEIAIMKHSVTAFCDDQSNEQFILNWGGTCIGLTYRDFLIDGSGIAPGMTIVGFLEPGYRCNGGTLFTNLLLEKFGSVSGIRQSEEAMDFVQQLTTPSLSYARTICRLIGWGDDGIPGKPKAKITGVCHVTGGGVWQKFGEMLPDGIGAVLDTMPRPADVLIQAQQWSKDVEDLYLSDYQAYGTLHGGCGMLVICASTEDVITVIDEARRDGIEAQVVGHTFDHSNKMDDKLIIHSRFTEGKILRSTQVD